MLRLLLILSTFLVSHIASAIHLDVAVSDDNGKLKTDFCLEGGPACDELPVLVLLGVPPFTVPIDVETGNQLFVSDFDDFEGGPNAVDDPGFISDVGQISGSLLVSYRAIGHLMYWDPVTKEWLDDVPGTTRVELFGGLNQVVNDPGQCGGLLICFIPDSTLFTETGIANNPSLIVGQTNASGQLHVHMDWFIEDASDNPGGPNGAYMVEMQLTAPGMQDSDPFFIMFAKGLSTEQFGEALASRITTTTPVPIPAYYYFILLTIILLIANKQLRT